MRSNNVWKRPGGREGRKDVCVCVSEKERERERSLGWVRRRERAAGEARCSIVTAVFVDLGCHELNSTFLPHHSGEVYFPFVGVQEKRARAAFSQTLASSISKKSLCMGTLPSSLML